MRQIIGAYHVAAFPGWEAMVTAQLSRIVRSGLAAVTGKVLIGVVGDSVEIPTNIRSILGDKSEFFHLGGLDRYEFPTLELLHERALSSIDPFDAWYIHTKGVSYGKARESERMASIIWRNNMERVIIDQHELCREKLQNYDICGWRWVWDTGLQPGGWRMFKFFSGNFWWAKSEYLKKVPPPQPEHLTSRWNAEMWLGQTNDIRVFSFD